MHLELIIVYRERGQFSIFCIKICSFLSIICRSAIFSIMCILTSLLKKQMTVGAWIYFWIFNSVLLINQVRIVYSIKRTHRNILCWRKWLSNGQAWSSFTYTVMGCDFKPFSNNCRFTVSKWMFVCVFVSMYAYIYIYIIHTCGTYIYV